jgi:D-serine deaminase-like pyridoxal phosphate-dependent protein
VIDRKRLSENVRTLKTHLPAGMGYRIVAKSLPSIDLISFIRDLSGTDRLMTFNQPMLSKLSVDMPDASQLLGKPLPVRAAQHYFETLPADVCASGRQCRMADRYARSACSNMHVTRFQNRTPTEDLSWSWMWDCTAAALPPARNSARRSKRLKRTPNLEFSGFMGYEPHIPSLPTTLGWRDKALKSAWDTYTAALEQASAPDRRRPHGRPDPQCRRQPDLPVLPDHGYCE